MIISLFLACSDTEAQTDIDHLNQRLLEQQVLIEYQNRKFDELETKIQNLETQLKERATTFAQELVKVSSSRHEKNKSSHVMNFIDF